VEIKCQLDATDEFFIADLTACSTCFGHHYAHHQELESIIKVVSACRIWCLVFKLSVWCGAEGCVSGLRAAALKSSGTSIYNFKKRKRNIFELAIIL
jgi:hypothetical protein